MSVIDFNSYASDSLASHDPTPTDSLAAPGGVTDCETQWDREIRNLGLFSSTRMANALSSRGAEPMLVSGLLRARSVNLFVGDSGLGKTPFGIQLGLCVAAGLPFLGRPTKRGRVVFFDAESDM